MQAINILPHWTPEENDVRFVAQNRDWALERKIKKRTTDTIHQMYNWAVGMNYDAMILGNHAFDEGHSTHVIAGELENSKCYLIKSGQERVYVSSTMGLHGIIVEHDGNQRRSICMARAKKQLERKNKLTVYLCKCSRETQKTLSDFRGLA